MSPFPQKTEYEWQVASDRFWLGFTPFWFDLLQWLLVVGAFGLAYKLTSNIYLGLVFALSSIFLFFYIQSEFYSKFKFENIFFIKNTNHRRSTSILVAGLLSTLAWFLINRTIDSIILFMNP